MNHVDTAALRSANEQIGAALAPFFAIAGAGREQGSAGPEHPEVRAVAEAHGATPAQVRLAWTLHQGAQVLAIPGTGTLAHLEENVAAAALRLGDAEVDRLDGLGRAAG